MSRVIIKNAQSGIGIGIDEMPYRKKPCLVVVQGNCETKYATFNNECAAKEFIGILKKFLGIEDGEVKT